MRKDNNGRGGKIPEMSTSGKLTQGFWRGLSQMSTFGRHERGEAVRADRSCLSLCPVTYKFMPPAW
jgi:hypothetical protein